MKGPSLSSLPDIALEKIIHNLAHTPGPYLQGSLALASTNHRIRAAVSRTICVDMSWLRSVSSHKAISAWLKLAKVAGNTKCICLCGSFNKLVPLIDFLPSDNLKQLNLSYIHKPGGDRAATLFRQVSSSLTSVFVESNQEVFEAICAARLTCLKQFTCTGFGVEFYDIFCHVLESLQHDGESTLTGVNFISVLSGDDFSNEAVSSVLPFCPSVTRCLVEGFASPDLHSLLQGFNNLGTLAIKDTVFSIDMLKGLLEKCPQIENYHIYVCEEWKEGGRELTEVFKLLGARMKKFNWHLLNTPAPFVFEDLARYCSGLEHLMFCTNAGFGFPDIPGTVTGNLQSLKLTFHAERKYRSSNNPEEGMMFWNYVTETVRSSPQLRKLSIRFLYFGRDTHEFPVNQIESMLAFLGDNLEEFSLEAGSLCWFNPEDTWMIEMLKLAAKYNHSLKKFCYEQPARWRPLPYNSEYRKRVLKALEDLECSVPHLDTVSIRKQLDGKLIG